MKQYSRHRVVTLAVFGIRKALMVSFLVFCHPWSPLSTSAAAAADKDGKNTGLEIHVSFGPDQSKTPLDGRLLVMLSTDPKDEPRFQINDSPKTQQIFGIDVDGLAPGTRGCHRFHGAGLSTRKSASASTRPVSGPGPAAQVRDVSPGDRPGRQAAHGPRRGAAMEQGARQPVQHAAGDHDRGQPEFRQRRFASVSTR